MTSSPFTGQHIVALPAALELWLLQERPLAATLLILMQVAPSWLVADVTQHSKTEHQRAERLSAAAKRASMAMARAALFWPLVARRLPSWLAKER